MGCHEVTGGEQTGFLEGPFRAAPERQRGFQEETEAACPGGAVTAGDWGLDHRIKRQFNP